MKYDNNNFILVSRAYSIQNEAHKAASPTFRLWPPQDNPWDMRRQPPLLPGGQSQSGALRLDAIHNTIV
jgi:hypothetical protein